MPRTEYSDQFKAEALAALDANGGVIKATAQRLGIPTTTLYNWSKGRGVPEDVSELGNKKRGDLAAKFEALAHDILDAVTPEKIGAAHLHQMTTAAGTAIDKARLLRGETTAHEERTFTVNRRNRYKGTSYPSTVGEA